MWSSTGSVGLDLRCRDVPGWSSDPSSEVLIVDDHPVRVDRQLEAAVDGVGIPPPGHTVRVRGQALVGLVDPMNPE